MEVGRGTADADKHEGQPSEEIKEDGSMKGTAEEDMREIENEDELAGASYVSR